MRVLAAGLALVAAGLVAAPVDARRELCVPRGCQGRRLSRVINCFAPVGRCVRAPQVPVKAGVNLFYTPRACWENGARLVTSWNGYGYDEEYFGAGGRFCMSTSYYGTSRDGGSFTIRSGRRSWRFDRGSWGSRERDELRCPSGRVFRGLRAQLQCDFPWYFPGFYLETECELGGCP